MPAQQSKFCREGCKGDDRLVNAAFEFAATATRLRHARDIADEVADRASPLSPHARQRLRALGVEEKYFALLFSADVVLIGDGSRFEWSAGVTDDSRAVKALLGFCRDIGNRIWDVWAWADRSSPAVTLWGRSGVVNEREALRWRVPEALAVYRTPLEWLVAGCVGVFVTDWRRAPFLLNDAGRLHARDVEHGELIERNFRASGLMAPKIFVPNAHQGGAA